MVAAMFKHCGVTKISSDIHDIHRNVKQKYLFHCTDNVNQIQCNNKISGDNIYT